VIARVSDCQVRILRLILWEMKSKGDGPTVCAISFQDFQPMWSWFTNVTDRWTDNMQLQYRALHYSASCSKLVIK